MATTRETRNAEIDRANHAAARNKQLAALGLDRPGIESLATLLRDDATFIEAQRRAGWKTQARQHGEAAALIDFWAEHYQPPAPTAGPNPHREPLDDIRPEQFVSPLAHTGVPNVDAALDKAFSTGSAADAMDAVIAAGRAGLLDPPPAHELPTSIKREPLTHITASGHHGRLGLPRDAVTVCEAPAPCLRSFRGSANCPDCIARFDAATTGKERVDPGDPAFSMTPQEKRVEMMRIDPAFVVAELMEDTSVTIEPTAALPLPRFIEPTAPPKRLTFAEVREHGMARQRGADHRSYSQLAAYKECGVRYAIDDLNRTPAWWNVGGTAVHYACEEISRTAHAEQIGQPAPLLYGPELWQRSFARAIAEAATESGTTPDQWQAAKKGAEGFDWWRIEGLAMVEGWARRLAALHNDGWQVWSLTDGTPAIELSLPLSTLDSEGGPQGIRVENIIDLIMVRGTDEYLIVDMKSGAHQPESPDQLTQYGLTLDLMVADGSSIDGAFWMARNDELIVVSDLRARRSRADLESEYEMFDTAEKAGVYLPGKTPRDTFGCKSCPVRDLCPAGPR